MSIVIPSYNTKDILIKCVRSIEKHSSVSPIELIIIDDCSEDGSFEAVKTEFPEAMVERNETNIGFVRTVNRGLRKSNGDYILILNSDTLFTEDSLTKMIDFMKKNPACGVAGCKICYPDGQIQYTCARGRVSPITHIFEQLYLSNLFPRSPLFGKELLSFWDHADSREVDVLSGTFLMLRRECLEDIGLLDERFEAFCEDIDICYRAKMAGWQVMYFAGTQVTHFSGQSFAFSPQSFITNYRSRYSFFQKYYPAFPEMLLKIVSMLGLMARIVVLIYLMVFCNHYRTNIIARKKLRGFIAALKWHAGLDRQRGSVKSFV